MGKIQSGLTKVEIGTGDDREELVNKTSIEDACHQENKEKYSQTNNTLMMDENMTDLTGYIGISSACLLASLFSCKSVNFFTHCSNIN